VSFVRDERVILAPITWQVHEHDAGWVLGANGSGKTTLLRNSAAMYSIPPPVACGVLGEELGHTDVPELRRRVGYLSAALAGSCAPSCAASTW